MMRLHKAATRFDKSILYDAYTSTRVGKGQLDPTDIYKLDGAAVTRRVISVDPATILPTRLAVRLGADIYLIGSPSTDEWNGLPIRTKYILHQANSLATIKTFAEALANLPGRSAYASREWNKDIPDPKVSSTYFNDYHIFIAHTEPVQQYDLIFIDNQWHICHAVHPSLSGFTDAVSHEIIGVGFETVTTTTETYNPTTDTYSGVTTSATMLRLRWQENFRFLTQAQENYEQGDEIAMVLKSAWPAVKPSDKVIFSDGEWRVLAARDEGLTFNLHIRRD